MLELTNKRIHRNYLKNSSQVRNTTIQDEVVELHHIINNLFFLLLQVPCRSLCFPEQDKDDVHLSDILFEENCRYRDKTPHVINTVISHARGVCD